MTQKQKETKSAAPEKAAIPKEFLALQGLLEKDKARFERIALEMLTEEITTAVHSFADVAKTAQSLEALFDQEFSDQVYDTLFNYFQALYDKIFAGRDPRRAAAPAPEEAEHSDEDIKEIISAQLKDAQDTQDKNIVMGEVPEPAKPKRPPIAVRRSTAPVTTAADVEAQKQIQATTQESSTSGGADTICLKCDWEGMEAECTKDRVGDFVALSCPSCGEPIS
jgi:hypothetical protein